MVECSTSFGSRTVMVKNVNPCSHLSSCPALVKKALELERPTQNDGFKSGMLF